MCKCLRCIVLPGFILKHRKRGATYVCANEILYFDGCENTSYDFFLSQTHCGTKSGSSLWRYRGLSTCHIKTFFQFNLQTPFDVLFTYMINMQQTCTIHSTSETVIIKLPYGMYALEINMFSSDGTYNCVECVLRFITSVEWLWHPWYLWLSIFFCFLLDDK